ncbi:thioesterase domain-containing protein [Streptomyces sp. NBC_00385]|uniref:thioesterase domain-containing protein n=1 Tax=Streptomyces sp. NBC_00385 TaxID=2975733 RepID=UPI002DD910DF|nr:thioesterase domain-containing protein [Streptomyces sp. NBC_00385]WRZ08187.1 alpha/beta fold hydrolase [Streptomyces sp. NBC_00385]
MIDQLLHDLRSNNVRIWAKEGRLHFDAPKDAMTPEMLALLSGAKEEILRRLEEGPGERRAGWEETPGEEPGPGGGVRLHRLTAAADGLVVFVLPAAGAGPSFFRPWAADAPAGVEVVLVHTPGREELIRDRPYRGVAPLADAIAAAVDGYGDRPFAVFGHSAGALIAHQVLRRVRSDAARLLVTAASTPPDRVVGEVAAMTDDDLLAAMAAWGGTPDQVLDDPLSRSGFLPCLRADLEVVESCARAEGDIEPIDVPVLALAGSEDTFAPLSESLRWARWSTAGFRAHLVPGGHFFPATEGAEILALVQRHAGAPAPRGA